MNRLILKLRAAWLAHCCVVLVFSAAILSACGGGAGNGPDALAGVGTGGSGLAEGTVSGFGSVFVDGVEYDDASASVQQDDGTGVAVNAELKLGQRVRLALDTSNKVRSAIVLPQLVGPISQATGAGNSFKVMGQEVRMGDNTVLAGFGAAMPALGDELEVHGAWIYDSSSAGYVLAASRVEKLATAPDPVQLSGIVQSISGLTLRINSALGTAIQAGSLPPGLSAGRMVRVWVSRSAYVAGAGKTMFASRLEDSTLGAADLAEQSLRLGGPVAQYNVASRTLELQGVKVQLPAGLQVDEAALSKGDFVALEVKRSGGALVATSLTLRAGAGGVSDLGQSVVLKAVTSGIDWSATPVRFSLRDVDVRASQLVVDVSCRQASANADLLIEVKGRLALATDTVVATEVHCTLMGNGSSAGGATVSRIGSVSQINLLAKSFLLQTASGSITVKWDSQTYLPAEFTKHPESLTGQRVEVEGVNQTGSLRARKIKPDH